MIKYYVSTIDRHNNGKRAGQIVTDSAWSADIESDAESMEEALKGETEWLAAATEDDDRVFAVIGIDTENGLIWWEDYQGNEYLTEVSIDIVEDTEED